MKRIFSLILAVAMAMGLSVQGFANEALVENIQSGLLLEDEDGLTKLGTFITSTLSDDEKEYMRDFFDVFTGSKDAGDYHYSILANKYFSSSKGVVYLTFVRTFQRPLAFCMCFNQDSPYVGLIMPFCPLVSDSGFSSYESLLPVSYMEWLYSSSSSTFTKYQYRCDYSQSGALNPTVNKGMLNNYSRASYILWSSDSNLVVSDDDRAYYNIMSPSNYRFATAEEIDNVTVEYPVGLAFVDDDGLLESVTPDPEPEEPDDNGDSSDGDDGDNSSGDEDSSRPSGGLGDHTSGGWDALGRPELSLPDVDSSKVGYDLSVWDSVLDAMLPTLTKVGGIVFIISLIILGLEIVLIIIRVILLSFLYRHWGDVLREQRTTYHVSEQYKYTANNSESHVYKHKGD